MNCPTGYWAWEPEGKGISVQIQLDVVDRLSTLMLDGFGALPRRGAEVGGILLGSFMPGDTRVVRIEDFVAVPCVHKFGPSFVLTDEELSGLRTTLDALKEREVEGTFVVGYYRSHTRDGLTLTGEDLQYSERFFADERQVILLVRPSLMHVSKGGFFLTENGALQPGTALEFPFRRAEMETGSAPPRRRLSSRMDRRSYPAFGAEGGDGGAQRPGVVPMPQHPGLASAGLGSPGMGNPGYATPGVAGDPNAPPEFRQGFPGAQSAHNPAAAAAAASMASPIPPVANDGRVKRGWIWYPLSFIFLLLGVLLGFQGALSLANDKQQQPQVIQDPYTLNLSVSQAGDDLSLRWDRSNTAVRTAPRGLLEITDGRFSKRVDLDAQQLRTGSVIYQHSTGDVKFRLEIFPNERAVLSESVAWKANP